MRRFIPLAIALLLASTLLAGAGFYLVVARPLRTLPRPIEAIQADWNDVASRMPDLPVREPIDPTLVDLIDRAKQDDADPASVAAIATWLTENRPNDPGCSMGYAEPAAVSLMDWYAVGRNLQLLDHPAPSLAVADAIRDRELLGLMVSKALVDRLLTPEEILAAVRREARCSDDLLTQMVAGERPDFRPQGTSLVVIEREQWVYRDSMARLLLAMEQAGDDREKLRSAFQSLEKPAHAPLAGLLVIGVGTVLADALSPPDPVRSPVPESAGTAAEP